MFLLKTLITHSLKKETGDFDKLLEGVYEDRTKFLCRGLLTFFIAIVNTIVQKTCRWLKMHYPLILQKMPLYSLKRLYYQIHKKNTHTHKQLTLNAYCKKRKCYKLFVLRRPTVLAIYIVPCGFMKFIEALRKLRPTSALSYTYGLDLDL